MRVCFGLTWTLPLEPSVSIGPSLRNPDRLQAQPLPHNDNTTWNRILCSSCQCHETPQNYVRITPDGNQLLWNDSILQEMVPPQKLQPLPEMSTSVAKMIIPRFPNKKLPEAVQHLKPPETNGYIAVRSCHVLWHQKTRGLVVACHVDY